MKLNGETRIGSVKTKRVDTADTNIEQQKFERFQNFYRNVLQNVSISIKTLEKLTDMTEEVVVFNEYCPAFYSSVIHNFWAQSVIELNKCFSGNWSFFKALDFIKANWDKIYTGKWVDETHWNDNTIEREEITFGKDKIFRHMREAEKILGLEENKKIIAILKDFRDKVFAHTDGDFPKNKLHLADLRKVFIFAVEVFNKIFVLYDRVARVLEPSNADDVRNLICVVNIYNKHQKEIIEMDVKEKYESRQMKEKSGK